MKTAISLAAGAFTLAMLCGSAAAGVYGAIYFSPTTRADGYTGNANSRQEAVDTAYSYCAANADDCIKGIEFWGGSCGAVAVGDRGGWGAAYGADEDEASEDALAYCSKHTRNCRVLKWVCSSTK